MDSAASDSSSRVASMTAVSSSCDRRCSRRSRQYRFEHKIREQFEHDKQTDHIERSRPALGGGKADQDRRARAEHGPDVRDESETRSQRRPDQGVQRT